MNQLAILIVVAVPFGATMYALASLWGSMMSWTTFALFVSFFFATGLGITVGFHRMATHSAFDAPPIVKGLILIFGCMAVQGAPVSWAAIHSKHHVLSDTEDDPHSPIHGFWHAHVGWLFTTRRAEPEKYARTLLNDKVTMWVSRTSFWWALLGLLIPYFIGGWEGFLWGSLVRVFLIHHVTWSVNSICHMFGRRPFETGRDLSRNNWIVGIFAMGEGWHNNHHAFPKSALHGLTWKQPDLSGQVIRALGWLHLAHDITIVPPQAIETRKLLRRAA
ncbi:MAG: acyl-CoA desaturase [Chloroflexi bacterium]|nr:acyl-CoA desaturase [Chloroflexota bacterium]